ncbi:gamma-glutamylcyclotransferase family protein [Tropicimonas sp. IMCC34043]|uniref:gamma-glutamylcyclotransferase family protein n=1 Tax=Tropicimonas sp. IMCC34043 TaxID=2248760 RepID=UPI000E23F33B|nr:gamma-glutamylcyclotransferase family protein [Tropicimonas sp. IMCC34043]
MAQDHVFGYGSLVNRATHALSAAVPARLDGWRRVWVATGFRPVAVLSVEPAPVAIEGLLAEVAASDWPGLDWRERSYDRLQVTATRLACGGPAPAQIYAVPRKLGTPQGSRHRLLLSYIDTVVQGFLETFGEAGAQRFFATTAGWQIPVLNDRAAPRYLNHRALTRWQQDFVDSELAARTPRIERAR